MKPQLFEKGISMALPDALSEGNELWVGKLRIRNRRYFLPDSRFFLTIGECCERLPHEIREKLPNSAQYDSIKANLDNIHSLRNPHVYLTRYLRRQRRCKHAIWPDIPILLFPGALRSEQIPILRWENRWVEDQVAISDVIHPDTHFLPILRDTA